MNKYKIFLGSAFLLTATVFGVNGVLAQDSEAADSERRAAFEERMQERRVEAEARREERWAEFSEENPELATEIGALRAERAAEREQAQAEFAEQYPNIAAALEDGRVNRAMLTDRPERGRGLNRHRRGPEQDGFRGRR
ncbi:hypothetical protein JYT97_02695 [Haliea sp. AH-315-K21]|uniref:Zinc resistance-associated protein n=1 Tax=SAR86 cluster bacterium TaxID=2030880 RepID=A0A2A5CA53_9GAMM|nr:hypothetical protein [Haliea sp. AH-315-K21]PCJ40246.1 MAG: hypothetical protein COA71_12115 [SAR86 cluster bacterium]